VKKTKKLISILLMRLKLKSKTIHPKKIGAVHVKQNPNLNLIHQLLRRDDDDADLGKHSESVQKRIKKLKFEYHEERRRKEAADREREAAVQYAQQIKGENDRLRKNLNEGESVLITQAKARIASELVGAKAAYKAAYEAGDADAVLDAQEKLMKLQNESSRVDNWTPPKQQAASGPSTTRLHVYQNLTPEPKLGSKRTRGSTRTEACSALQC
jgi:hypothetical protein